MEVYSNKIILNYIQKPSPYRAVNTLSVSVIKTSQLMLYREIMAVCSQIHTKYINTLCGQNVELINFETRDLCSNHPTAVFSVFSAR